MKSHVKENLAKNAILNGIRLIPRTDGNSTVELSGLAWELVESLADDVKVSNFIYTPSKMWQADGEYKGSKITLQNNDLGELVLAIKKKLMVEDNE